MPGVAAAMEALARSALVNAPITNMPGVAAAMEALARSALVNAPITNMPGATAAIKTVVNSALASAPGASIFSAGSALAAGLRVVDELTPLDRVVSQYALTSRALEQVVDLGALTSWRSALEANGRVEALLRQPAMPSSVLSELAAISRAQVDLTDWAVLRSPDKSLLSRTSGWPVSAWRNVLAESVDDENELPVFVATGRTNLALLGSDLLTSPDADPEVIAEGADRVGSDVVEPWMAARQQVTADLYEVLARLDRKIPELLNGAWDDISRNGPAAAEKAANCAVEAIDRALRIAAPDDAVRAWHQETSRPASEWEGRDRPPHRLRVKYLYRDLAGARDLVVSQVDAMATVVKRLRGRIEAAKHASQGDLVAVRALVCQAESVLITLFVGTSSQTD
jgi:hypothetical protein